MNIQLGRTVILVKDYDKALDFYQKNFDCKVLFNQDSSFGLRFLHIGFGNNDNTGIWFLKADGKEEEQRVGNQTAGQPTLVLYTDNVKALYEKLLANKVTIKIPPADNPEYSFFHCYDLYGNEIVVVELKQ